MNIAINEEDQKQCTHCKQWKPLSKFSFRKRQNVYQSWCKECINNQSLISTSPEMDIHEQIVIDKLKQNGIQAVSGKELVKEYVDIVAWGCIKIEVKSSILHKGKNFAFRFSERQRTDEVKNDFVVLVCCWETEKTFHILPGNDDCFYIAGKKKSVVMYQPLANRRKFTKFYALLSPLKMYESQEKWLIIEDKRQEISELLKGSV